MESMGMKEEKLFNGIYDGKKILVTGDTGFKGSWLSIWLNEMGAEVYGYALPPKTEKDNFVRSGLKDKISHTDGDVRDYNRLVQTINKIEPDIAFHLAAQPLVLESYRNPRETFETNLMGTVNFFEAVRNCQSIKAAINITSDKCYKNNEWLWGYRENESMGGDDPYSASKGCSELITNAYLKSFFSIAKCHIASARAGNVIGGGDWAENRIVPDFFRALELNKEIELRNPGSTRPWQHVLEPLSGYLLLCAKLYEDGEKFSGAWNFGPLESAQHTVLELINRITELFGKGEVKSDDSKIKLHEANLLKLDISKAISQLDWHPALDFEETVSMTVEGYKAELSGTDVYKSRVSQLREYIKKAQKKNISWANNSTLNT
jgi:CDP-glucose 4,6-dehydratase